MLLCLELGFYPNPPRTPRSPASSACLGCHSVARPYAYSPACSSLFFFLPFDSLLLMTCIPKRSIALCNIICAYYIPQPEVLHFHRTLTWQSPLFCTQHGKLQCLAPGLQTFRPKGGLFRGTPRFLKGFGNSFLKSGFEQ